VFSKSDSCLEVTVLILGSGTGFPLMFGVCAQFHPISELATSASSDISFSAYYVNNYVTFLVITAVDMRKD
jgi:hypothetical protein